MELSSSAAGIGSDPFQIGGGCLGPSAKSGVENICRAAAALPVGGNEPEFCALGSGLQFTPPQDRERGGLGLEYNLT